jgi:hypothetical protein
MQRFSLSRGRLSLGRRRRAAGGAPPPVLQDPVLSGTSIDDGAPPGTPVGAFSGQAPGATLALTDDAGGRFALSGTSLVTGLVQTDYAVAPEHVITLRQTLGLAFRDTAFVIAVLPALVGRPVGMTVTLAGSNRMPSGKAAGSIAVTTGTRTETFNGAFGGTNRTPTGTAVGTIT